ncbi:phosphate ABC transporter substrate-binding protein PstS [Chamaesiphon minutus]|uniref:Phosphate-binding protein n=1 Tax=Chamaesiphon minutus (strain ATCC 27169 / PCC 6605) TaxID=1173020 RepID=K9UI11_CHAP6|nr:phosphate ABC transporter substrate-binding protein PstS [Chamaesiphon minutus]AFY94101.1 phosphate ABC transporter, phosphate-binding protein [Chamaesiphon minutus PCC 6605]
MKIDLNQLIGETSKQERRANYITKATDRSRYMLIPIALTIGMSMSACTPTSPDVATPPTGGTSTPAPAAGGGSSSALSGAGASFPAPLYQRWFNDYNKANPGTQISYQSVGSGAGVEQFLAGTVDFGATDAPLKAEERAKFKTKYGAEPIQIPMTGGSVVFAYNIEGVKDLKLSRAAYCGIAAGKITKWNDPAIAKTNAGAKLPDQAIQFVHRSDGSGTTFQFTTHLKAACPGVWTAGANKSVSWPAGTGAKGNEGVAAQVKQTPNSIGYVEYSYGKETALTMAAIENKSGQIIVPSPEAGAEAFVGQTVPADLALTVPDSANPKAYPISGLTWLLLYPQPKDAAKQTALKSTIEWALTTGKAAAIELGYIPLEADLVTKVKAELNKAK